MGYKFSKLGKVFKTGEDGRIIYSDSYPEIRERVSEKQYAAQLPFEVSYNIFSDACDILSEGWDEEEFFERASVYVSDRLGYITNWNQDEVSEIMKEYQCEDIQTAAAIWYDNQVNEAVRILADEFEEENEENEENEDE